jgi:hypothetical protein
MKVSNRRPADVNGVAPTVVIELGVNVNFCFAIPDVVNNLVSFRCSTHAVYLHS